MKSCVPLVAKGAASLRREEDSPGISITPWISHRADRWLAPALSKCVTRKNQKETLKLWLTAWALDLGFWDRLYHKCMIAYQTWTLSEPVYSTISQKEGWELPKRQPGTWHPMIRLPPSVWTVMNASVQALKWAPEHWAVLVLSKPAFLDSSRTEQTFPSSCFELCPKSSFCLPAHPYILILLS